MTTRSTGTESDPTPSSDRSSRSSREARPRLRDRVPARRGRLTRVERLRRRAVAADKALVFGDHGTERDSPAASKTGPTTRSAFRLVCWNIEDGLDIDGTIAGLIGHPNLANADAICLQEMDPEGVERIARELGLRYLYMESSQDERSGRGFGNAVLSPWPLTDHVAVPLPHMAKAYGRPRAAVGATVTRSPSSDDSMSVSVWSVHAEIPPLSLSRRVAQFTAVAARATIPNPDHLLIAGDFNTTTLTAVDAIDELYEMFDLERLTQPAGPSLRRAGRLFYLDHIFGRGLDVHGVGVERTVIASDHWPMWVDVAPAVRQ